MSGTQMATTVTAVYTRDDRDWLVALEEEPRCHSWGRTISEARRHIKEAASLWFDEVEIVDRVVPPRSIAEAVTRAFEARNQAASANDRFRLAWEEAACALVQTAGLSFRDAGAILGVSHQRIAQLVGGK